MGELNKEFLKVNDNFGDAAKILDQKEAKLQEQISKL